MSHKAGKVETVEIARIPTRAERRWMADRARAGGGLPVQDMTLLLPEVRGRLDRLQGKELGQRHLGAPPVATQRWLGGVVGRGILRRAENEDPLAYMDERQIRDHIAARNEQSGLGMSDAEVSKAAAAEFQAAQARNAERMRRQFFGRAYAPSATAPDISAARKRSFWEPLNRRGVLAGAVPVAGGTAPVAKRAASTKSQKGTRQDVKGGRTVRAAEGAGNPLDIDTHLDGSYIRQGEDGQYTWYNKDNSIRSTAKDYVKMGEGGRAFFGDLSTGEGQVTIGGDWRNASKVTGFKVQDDTNEDGFGDITTYSYNAGGRSMTFSYGADNKPVTAQSKVTAKYGEGEDAPTATVTTNLLEANKPHPKLGSHPPATTVKDVNGNEFSLKRSDPIKSYLRNGASITPVTNAMVHDGELLDLVDKVQDLRDRRTGSKLAAAESGAAKNVNSVASGIVSEDLSGKSYSQIQERNEQIVSKMQKALTDLNTARVARNADWVKFLAGTDSVDEAKKDPLAAAVFSHLGNTAVATPATREDALKYLHEAWRYKKQSDEEKRKKVLVAPSGAKSGRTARAAMGAGVAGDFVDATEDVSPEAPKTYEQQLFGRVGQKGSERYNRIKDEYAKIQGAFRTKNGRAMDRTTAVLRAMLGTGFMTRDEVTHFARNIRHERDMELARSLADRELDASGRKVDPMAFYVSRAFDPGVGAKTWSARRDAVLASLNDPSNAAGWTSENKLFLAHRYGLAPQVREHYSRDYDPATYGRGGDLGTVDTGVVPYRRTPAGAVVTGQTPAAYVPVDAPKNFHLKALSPGFRNLNVSRQRARGFVPVVEYNMDNPLVWRERTGRFAPMEGEFVDPTWHHIPVRGIRYSTRKRR